MIGNVVAGCTLGTNLEVRNFEPGAGHRIYFDIKFPCYGYITKWEIKARVAGTVYVDIWTLTGTDTYKLVSKTLLEPTTPGIYTLELAEEDYIKIIPGQVLGYHYIESKSSNHVVPEVSSAESMAGMPFVDSQLSRAYAELIYDSALPIGGTYGPKTSNRVTGRSPNILPHVTYSK